MNFGKKQVDFWGIWDNSGDNQDDSGDNQDVFGENQDDFGKNQDEFVEQLNEFGRFSGKLGRFSFAPSEIYDFQRNFNVFVQTFIYATESAAH